MFDDCLITKQSRIDMFFDLFSRKAQFAGETIMKTNMTLENPDVQEEIHLHSWWIFHCHSFIFGECEPSKCQADLAA